VLIYGILFISSLLSVVKPTMNRKEAERAMMNLALDSNFAVPGDAGFPLNQAFEAPQDRAGVEVLRGYVGQMRQELAVRLGERLFDGGEGTPSKVSFCVCAQLWRNEANELVCVIVVAEFPEAQVHEQGAVRMNEWMDRWVE